MDAGQILRYWLVGKMNRPNARRAVGGQRAAASRQGAGERRAVADALADAGRERDPAPALARGNRPPFLWRARL